MYDVSSMLLGGTSQHFLQPKPRRIEFKRGSRVEEVVVTSWTRVQLEAFPHAGGIMAPRS